jgi:type IV pilus biogenesis protein CpaD/CtpE
MSTLRFPTVPRPAARVIAALALATLGGCASNPFVDHYVGTRRASTNAPMRLLTETELPRLGTSKFDVDVVAGKLPGDAQAQAAAEEIGAAAYWWSSRPKYNAANAVAKQLDRGGRVGQTTASGPGWNEKAIKWYEFEAVFYATTPEK